MNKEQAKDRIKQLIEKFCLQIDYYKSNNYNETQTRRDFIDPFFAALGWDIDNEKQQLETYRDVRHEDKIKINGHTKAPDYSFNLKGKRKFFVEAKKPSVPIKVNPEPALQVRNYGWNGKLLISIVTDFEEFAIYDCTKKMRKNDTAASKRLKYIYYTDYLQEFDFIWNTFAYENVVNQSIEIFAKHNIDFKTTEPVDKEFLQSLDKWREYLATTIALRNKQLDEDEINFAVQQTIDRIVFLRVCEDRKIEREGYLLHISKTKGNVYQNLFTYFQTADQKYNSGLFDFNKDKITKDINIDNKVIKNIITELYETGFNFAVMPVEILGYAYEQFLGKVIRLTPAHHAVIEEKPEVRKAGGVFYTPDYIVNNIVLNTIGKLIENKTPEEISKIKILDPSCGSGSFLLGAYQYLLEYHLFYYNKNKSNKKIKENPLTADNQLTSKEKKRILLNNIYGVDIDNQAVEVTKLSLLLKALENETETSINTSLQLFNERVLPTIDENIKSGNSIVSPEFYGNEIEFSVEIEKKIKSFDWKSEYKEIIDNGGFDVVIGNPPYIDSEEMVKTHKDERNYCSLSYTCAKGNWDIYCVFVEKGIKLLKNNGVFGMIIPNKFLSMPYGDYLKNFLSNYSIQTIYDYSSVSVFVSYDRKISVYPIILVANKSENKNSTSIYYKLKETEFLSIVDYQNDFIITKGDTDWTQKFARNTSLIEDIIGKSVSLTKHFVIENAATVSEAYKLKEILTENENVTANELKFVNTGTIDRYTFLWGQGKTQYIKQGYKFPVVSKKDLQTYFPKRLKQAELEKLVCAGMIKNLEWAYDNGEVLAGKSTTIIYNKSTTYSLKYLLALLNSDLYSYLYRNLFRNNSMSGGYLNVSKKQLEKFYFFEIDFSNQIQNKLYIEIINKVDETIKLFKELKTLKLDSQKQLLYRRIETNQTRINDCIYSLYSLDNDIKQQIEKQ